MADMVADMAADMKVHMVADMKEDKVADMEVDKVADMVADMVAEEKKLTLTSTSIQKSNLVVELVGHGGWLIN